MGMYTQGGVRHIRVAPGEGFDHVGILVGRTALDGGGEVQDEIRLAVRPPRVVDRRGEIDDESQPAVAELLRRKFIMNRVAHAILFQCFGDHLRRGNRHLRDFRLGFMKDELPMEVAGRDVAVDGRLPHALQRFDGAGDQVFTGRGEYGNPDVVRDQVLCDQPPHELEFLRRGCRISHFDLLEADLRQHLEIADLGRHVHRTGERLVAVAQID